MSAFGRSPWAALRVAAGLLSLPVMLAGTPGAGAPALPDPSTPPASAVPTPAALGRAQGRILYFKNCAHCHGNDQSGDEGPDLHELEITNRRIATVIRRGIKGEMPSFARKLDDADVAALVAFLRSLDSTPGPS